MTWKIESPSSIQPGTLPPSKDLGFGRHFANYMFLSHFKRGLGWTDSKIVPYSNLSLSPAATVLHYGQALFEGLKAFRQKDQSVAIFRPEFNWQRMTQGAERLCMEAPPLDLWRQALNDLIRICDGYVPNERGTSLYIRPTLIATEGFLGVRPSNEYLFFIILSPVGSYYSEGHKPVKIWVEKEYLRAAPGGLGMTKAAANYGGSLKAAFHAKTKNCAQVLWLDVTKTFVQEVGTMNVFFVLKDEVVTPELDGCILEGGTRQVVIEILRTKGHKVSERKIAWSEIVEASQNAELLEAFGTGTAAVISPIGEFASDTESVVLPPARPLANFLYDEITAIHYGEKPDTMGWMTPVV